MRVKNSIIVSIAAILSGVLLQLNTLGLTGDLIPSDLLVKLWPLLLVAAGLDLLFAQRRLVASMIIMFLAAALLCTQFLEAGWKNQVWQIFVRYWPVLLILFGIDMIFSGHNLINAAVIITAVVVLVVVLLTVFDVPVSGGLPIDLSKITSVIPDMDLRSFFLEPVQPGTEAENGAASSADIPPVVSDGSGTVSIAMPEQKRASLEIRPVSGRISLKVGKMGKLLKGTVNLNPKETLAAEASLKGKSAVYKIGSEGRRDKSGSSVWDLTVTPNRKTDINVILNDGYLKADLRGLKPNSVSLENKSGPVDVMTPAACKAVIKIKAGNGDIRVYIPKGASISCTISGASKVDFPQNSYTFSGGSLTPVNPEGTPIPVEITSRKGMVRIIESE